jgi:quercetin 2,3-dioxygenase
MCDPHYEEFEAGTRPIATGDGYTIKVVSGTFQNVTATQAGRTPVSLLDIRITRPGVTLPISVPRGQVGMAYTYRGAAEVVWGAGGGGSSSGALPEGTAALFDEGEAGDGLVFRTRDDARLVQVPAPHVDVSRATEETAAAILLIFGDPIREPIARYGPFVMNTQEEIKQAFADFRSGKLERESRIKTEGGKGKGKGGEGEGEL